MSREKIQSTLKRVLSERLDLCMEEDEISSEVPLFGYNDMGEGLGLDSIDVLEIVAVVKQYFGIQINASEDKGIFRDINTLSKFIESNQNVIIGS